MGHSSLVSPVLPMKSGSETSFGYKIKILICQLKSAESNLSYPVVHGGVKTVTGGTAEAENHLSHWRTAVKGSYVPRPSIVRGQRAGTARSRIRSRLIPTVRTVRVGTVAPIIRAMAPNRNRAGSMASVRTVATFRTRATVSSGVAPMATPITRAMAMLKARTRSRNRTTALGRTIRAAP